MTIPNASQAQIGILEEVTLGTLPSPAEFAAMRVTGESLEPKRDNVVSQEIRPDRNVPDIVQVGGMASGGFNFELSYATFDALLESALFSSWTGSPANTLVNGIVPKSFHVQKKFELGATDQYYLFTGMMVDTLDLSIRSKQIVTGSVSFMGLTGTLSQTATGTTTAANTNPVLNAASHLTLTKVMVSPAPTIRAVTLRISNKLRMQDQCASVDAAGIGASRCEVTGSFEAYFESEAIADLYLAGTAGGLDITIGSTTGSKYQIQVPTLKILTATNVAGGNDQDVMYSCTFQGVYDSGIAGTIQIDKGVS